MIWQVRWRLPDGNERTRSFETKREAVVFKAEREREAARGENRLDTQAAKLKLTTIWDRWKSTAELRLRTKTFESYEGHWRLRIEPVLGAWPVGKITQEAIEEWAKNLKIDASGKRSAHLLLRSLLDRAVADGAVPFNRALLVALPELPIRERHLYLTAQQVEDLATKCDKYGDVVRLLAYSGLRWGELAGLRVADVDLTRKRLYVRQAVTFAGGRANVGLPKSRSSVRTVPMTNSVSEILTKRISGKMPSEWAVASPEGKVLSATNWRRASGWNAAVKSIGLDAKTLGTKGGLRPHDLRHTYASLARKAGADLKYISKTMGHASIVTTAAIYADLFDDELDDVALKLDALVDSSQIVEGGPFVAHSDESGEDSIDKTDDDLGE